MSENARPRGARVGIDVGGTFTDFVLSDADGDRLVHYKEPSTPNDPSRAVVQGFVNCVTKAGLTPADVELILHGTTIGLNAIIQRTGAEIGLVVTRGFRDILEIARSRMPSSFDFHANKEEPLVPPATGFSRSTPALTRRVGPFGSRMNPQSQNSDNASPLPGWMRSHWLRSTVTPRPIKKEKSPTLCKRGCLMSR